MSPANASASQHSQSSDPRADAELVRILAEPNRAAAAAAMREILRRYQGRVWRLAYRLTTNAAAADDLAQETFLRLCQTARRYQPTAALGTYLHRIVVNLIIDARRTRHPALALEAVEPVLRAQAQGDTLVAAERAHRVQAALADLPERQRVAVILHRYEGLAYRDIAEVMQASPAAVESLIMRGYTQLRQTLADLGET